MQQAKFSPNGRVGLYKGRSALGSVVQRDDHDLISFRDDAASQNIAVNSQGNRPSVTWKEICSSIYTTSRCFKFVPQFSAFFAKDS